MSLYKILGVSTCAFDHEIADAYRKLARKHHPDAGGDAEKFKAIAHAYEVLSDPEKRRHYDLTGETAPVPSVVTSTVVQLTRELFGKSDFPVRNMSDRIDAQRQDYKRQKAACAKSIEELEKQLDQFSTLNAETTNTEARDLIANVVLELIEEKRAELKSLESEIEIGTQILTYLNGLKDKPRHGGSFDFKVTRYGQGFEIPAPSLRDIWP